MKGIKELQQVITQENHAAVADSMEAHAKTMVFPVGARNEAYTALA